MWRHCLPVTGSGGVAVWALVAAIAASLSSAAQYQVTDLGLLPGHWSFVSGVSDSGVAVGTYRNDATNENYRGWVFMDGVRTLIQPPEGMTISQVFGISRAGVVVGGFEGPGSSRGFTWTREGGVSYVADGSQPGGLARTAAGISDDGSYIAGPRYLKHGDTVYAPPFDMGAGRCHLGVSNSGEVVGYWHPLDDYAFYWKPPAAAVSPLGKSDFSYAHAINNRGVVVGESSVAPGGAFVWKVGDNSVTYLETFGGTWYDAVAYDVNDFDVVVGTARDAANVRRAFSWTSAGGLVNLNTLIDASSGWLLSEATVINEMGTIAGNGVFGGEQRGFLLTPVPEPTAISMVAVGLLALRRRRASRTSRQAQTLPQDPVSRVLTANWPQCC